MVREYPSGTGCYCSIGQQRAGGGHPLGSRLDLLPDPQESSPLTGPVVKSARSARGHLPISIGGGLPSATMKIRGTTQPVK